MLLAGVLFASASRAEDDNPFSLPEGALARLGKGSIGLDDRAVAYSPDGTRLAVASSRGIWLYDADTGAEVALFTGHTDGVSFVSFSPDGQTLASGSGDGTILLWDGPYIISVASEQRKAILDHAGWVLSVSFSPDGTILASGSWGGTIRLWDVASGQEKATLEGHEHGFFSVAFSPDGTILASGSWGGTIRLWDVASGQEKAILQGHTDEVRSVSFSPDDQTLASASWDETIRLWDVVSGQEKAILQGHTDEVRSVSFSPDGQTLASGSLDGTVRLWNVTPYITPSAPKAIHAASLPAQTALLANYPNPFNSRTQVGYRLAAPGMVRLSIYNALGQSVRTLVDQVQDTGMYQVAWAMGAMVVLQETQ